MELPSFDIQNPPTERELLDLVLPRLIELLPPTWQAQTTRAPSRNDGALQIDAPDGRRGTLTLEVESLVNARDVPAIAAQVRDQADARAEDGGLVVARYLSPRAREALDAAELSYLDSTGNASIVLSEPGLALRASGADRDPYRGSDRPTLTLKGAPAAKVVRALADCRPPWTMRSLADEAQASLGSTARAVDFLDREALISRDRRGSIVDVDWDPMLRRWAEDYDLVKRRRVLMLVAPRGWEAVENRLREGNVDDEYVVSGSFAARRLAPYAEPRLGLIYAKQDSDSLADWLGARPAPSRPNLLIVEPTDDTPFQRPQEANGLRFAAPSQVAVDLLQGPGRNPQEALALLDWMRENETAWRT